jgi:hypothetical protein
MHTPKVQPIPPPPNPVPREQDAAVLAARQNERRRQMSAYGRRSTILTGNSGAGDTSMMAPTLTGA